MRPAQTRAVRNSPSIPDCIESANGSFAADGILRAAHQACGKSVALVHGTALCLVWAMVSRQTVRRLALAMPEACDESTAERLVFSVAGKGFAWTYAERIAPRTPRRLRLDVLAVCCPVEWKEMRIEAAPHIFFDDDHYRGYPAVLVRLDAIDAKELAGLLENAWRLKAPKRLSKAEGPKRPKARAARPL
jgi:hypothetical protein